MNRPIYFLLTSATLWLGVSLARRNRKRKSKIRTMKSILLLAVGFALLVPLTALEAANASNTSAKPNIVYLLADDLGWGDLGANGASIPTPHLDRLFAQGVGLDNFMGWCVCSPTRAMLLTGRHPFRVGTGPEAGGELAKDETTIADAFKAHGYRTGVFGKWHNGGDPDTPEYRRAFEEAWKTMPRGEKGVRNHLCDAPVGPVSCKWFLTPLSR